MLWIGSLRCNKKIGIKSLIIGIDYADYEVPSVPISDIPNQLHNRAVNLHNVRRIFIRSVFMYIVQYAWHLKKGSAHKFAWLIISLKRLFTLIIILLILCKPSHFSSLYLTNNYSVLIYRLNYFRHRPGEINKEQVSQAKDSMGYCMTDQSICFII